MPPPNRPTATRLNVVVSGLDFVALPIGMLLATPILVDRLGVEQFGVFVLINALIAFGSVINFGFADTALKYTSHYLMTGRPERAAELIRTLSALTIAGGAVITALLIGTAPLSSQAFNIAHMPDSVESLQIAAWLVPVRLMESLYVSSLRGSYRYDLATLATTTAKIATVCAYVVLAWIGHGLPTLLLAAVLLTTASTAVLAAFCFRIGNMLPWISWRVLAEIRSYSAWSWLQSICGLAYANIDKLLVSVLLGPVALGIYGLCLQLAQTIHLGLAALSHTLFPRISMLSAREEPRREEASNKEVRQLYSRASHTLAVLAILLGSLVAVFSREILAAWVGSAIAMQGDWILTLLAISYGWFAATGIVVYYTLNGLGKARVQALISLWAAGLMTLCCVLLIPKLALVGAALARFPDLIIRVGVRVHIARTLLGCTNAVAAFDFLWMTAVAVAGELLLKHGIQFFEGSVPLMRLDITVLILGFTGLLFWFMHAWTPSAFRLTVRPPTGENR